MITQVPLIYGGKENLRQFAEDCKKFGYRLLTEDNMASLYNFSKGCIKLNGNTLDGMDISETAFKILVTAKDYSHIKPKNIRTFHLPANYTEALSFMEHNMRLFNKETLTYEIY